MLYFILKAALSGIVVAAVSAVAKRYPGLGGLVASLPLVSVLGMIWLWRDAPDRDRMAAHATGTFWFVLPSLPMFLLMPALLKRGVGFWPALGAGCGLTLSLYLAMLWIGPKLGLRLSLPLALRTQPEQSAGVDDIAFALPPEGFTPEGVEAPPGLAFDAVGRPAVTDACTRGAAKLLIGLGYAPLAEVPLPNGRRADLMALDQKGRIAIVEVKSSLEDYRADAKWPEYAPFCDRFFFAVNCDFPRSVLPTGCGLIVCDGFGGEVMIPAVETPLAPARRKALTLHIARLAAWRALR